MAEESSRGAEWKDVEVKVKSLKSTTADREEVNTNWVGQGSDGTSSESWFSRRKAAQARLRPGAPKLRQRIT